MRLRRMMTSWIDWSRACPMWSDPVTLGGGMTMQKGGPPAFSSGRKIPAFSQREYQCASTCCGSYAGSIGVSPHGGGDCRHQAPDTRHQKVADLKRDSSLGLEPGAWRLLLRAALLGKGLADVLHRDQRRVDPLPHDRAVDDHARHVVARRPLVHRVQQDLFEDGAQPA